MFVSEQLFLVIIGLVNSFCFYYCHYKCFTFSVRGTTYDQMILEEIELNEKVTIQSVNYPQCCTEVVHTVRCNSEHGPCYIRLEFSDLDLPRGSTLHVSQ